MAVINQVQLTPVTQLGSSDGLIYSSPLLTVSKIGRAVFCNTDTAAHTITVNIVPSGGSSATSNQILQAYTLAAGQTYVSPELAGAVLPPGSMVRGLASSASVVNVTLSGITITGT